MSKATENIPVVDYDVVFWDGNPHTVDAAGHTIAGHPAVAFSRVDDRGRKLGVIYRPAHVVAEGQSAALEIVEGWAVIRTPDNQFIPMEPDEARARFSIEEEPTVPHSKAKAKALPAKGAE